MKVKLDENIPVKSATHLRAIGFDVDTVHDEHLVGSPDETVWQAAQAEGRFLEIRAWARCVVVATPNKVRVLRRSVTQD